MTETSLIGWAATSEELEVVDAVREKTFEKTRTGVIRKAVMKYARSVGVKVAEA